MEPSPVAPWYRFTGWVAGAAVLALVGVCGYGVLRFGWPLGSGGGVVASASPRDPSRQASDTREALAPTTGSASLVAGRDTGAKGMLVIEPSEPALATVFRFERDDPTKAPDDLSRSLLERRPRAELRPLSRLRTP